MALWHLRSRKKPTGGRLQKNRKKRKSDRGNLFVDTKIGKKKLAKQRVTGAGTKLRLYSVDIVNLNDSKSGKSNV